MGYSLVFYNFNQRRLNSAWGAALAANFCNIDQDLRNKDGLISHRTVWNLTVNWAAWTSPV